MSTARGDDKANSIRKKSYQFLSCIVLNRTWVCLCSTLKHLWKVSEKYFSPDNVFIEVKFMEYETTRLLLQLREKILLSEQTVNIYLKAGGLSI